MEIMWGNIQDLPGFQHVSLINHFAPIGSQYAVVVTSIVWTSNCRAMASLTGLRDQDNLGPKHLQKPIILFIKLPSFV